MPQNAQKSSPLPPATYSAPAISTNAERLRRSMGLSNKPIIDADDPPHTVPPKPPSGWDTKKGPAKMHKGGIVQGKKGANIPITAEAGELVISAKKTKLLMKGLDGLKNKGKRKK